MPRFVSVFMSVVFAFTALVAAASAAEPSGFSCDSLAIRRVDSMKFEFRTNLTAPQGAEDAKLNYQFGDGARAYTDPVTETFLLVDADGERTTFDMSPDGGVYYVYPESGIYVATVLVAIGQPDGNTWIGSCKTTIGIQSNAQPDGDSPTSGATVIDEHFNEFDGKVCYRGTTLHTTLRGAREANLVQAGQGSFTYETTQDSTTFGACLKDGLPTGELRLAGEPFVYLTYCDPNYVVGDMRLTFGVTPGGLEPNTAYLAYPVDYDPCGSDTDVVKFVSDMNMESWRSVCMATSILVVYESINPEKAATQFRCDPVIALP